MTMSSMTWERLDIILADGRVITLRSDDTIFMGSVQKPVQVDLTDQKGPFTYEIREGDTVVIIQPRDGLHGQEIHSGSLEVSP